MNSDYRECERIAAQMLGRSAPDLFRSDYESLLDALQIVDRYVRSSGEGAGLVSREVIATIIHNWKKEERLKNTIT